MAQSNPMKITLKKLPKSTYEATVSIDQKTIENTRQEVIKHLAQTMEIKGYRKGKAPLEAVEKNADPNHIQGNTINALATQAAIRVIKEHHLNPIIPPKADISEETEQGLVLKITLAEKPEVTLGEYRNKLKELLSKKEGTSQIAVAESLAEAEKEGSKEKRETPPHLEFEEVIKVLQETCSAEIPDLLIERETTARLSQLVTRIDSAGLSLEQYLESQQTSLDKLKEKYQEQAREA